MDTTEPLVKAPSLVLVHRAQVASWHSHALPRVFATHGANFVRVDARMRFRIPHAKCISYFVYPVIDKFPKCGQNWQIRCCEMRRGMVRTFPCDISALCAVPSPE